MSKYLEGHYTNLHYSFFFNFTWWYLQVLLVENQKLQHEKYCLHTIPQQGQRNYQ